MPWKIPQKISLLAVAILFLFTFFNLILDAPRMLIGNDNSFQTTVDNIEYGFANAYKLV